MPVLIAVAAAAPTEQVAALRAAGCEVVELSGTSRAERLAQLLDELGRRRFTNVLVEGGGTLLGALFDLGEVDEVHAFIAPKLIGGAQATTPLAGAGLAKMAEARALDDVEIRQLGGDVYLSGRVRK